MTTIQNMLADMRRELMSTNPPLGVSTTPAEGFRTHRFESEVPLSCSTGAIAVSFILSGVKTVTVGGRFISYGAGEGLLSGAALPSTFRAMHASPEEPFLSVSLALDRATLIELAEHLPQTDQKENAELPPEAISLCLSRLKTCSLTLSGSSSCSERPSLHRCEPPALFATFTAFCWPALPQRGSCRFCVKAPRRTPSFVPLGGCGAISINPSPSKLWRSFTACRRRIFIANSKQLPG